VTIKTRCRSHFPEVPLRKLRCEDASGEGEEIIRGSRSQIEDREERGRGDHQEEAEARLKIQ